METGEIGEQSMQGVDISGLDRAQQFECSVFVSRGLVGTGGDQALTITDQPDINTPGDTLLPSPPLSSIISPSPHHSLPCPQSRPPGP